MKKIASVFMIICALIIVAFEISKSVEYKKMINDAGKANGVVTSTTSDKVMLRGKSHIVYSAVVEYKVNGEKYTASVPISNSMPPEKMIIYYDKNSPEKVFDPPIGIKDALVLSAIMALAGVAMLVWQRE